MERGSESVSLVYLQYRGAMDHGKLMKGFRASDGIVLYQALRASWVQRIQEQVFRLYTRKWKILFWQWKA